MDLQKKDTPDKSTPGTLIDEQTSSPESDGQPSEKKIEEKIEARNLVDDKSPAGDSGPEDD